MPWMDSRLDLLQINAMENLKEFTKNSNKYYQDLQRVIREYIGRIIWKDIRSYSCQNKIFSFFHWPFRIFYWDMDSNRT